jgi:hypothetical protein
MTWSKPIPTSEDVVNVFFDSIEQPSPVDGVMLVGDRGIHYAAYPFSFNTTQNPFQSRQGNLANFLTYTAAIDPFNRSNLFAVAQDQLRTLQIGQGKQPSTWNYTTTGNEVGKVIFDPLHRNVLYNLCQVNNSFVTRSSDGGKTWTSAFQGINTREFVASANQNDYNAFILDPQHPSDLFLGGQGVWQTRNRGQSWTEITGKPIEAGIQVDAIALAPSNDRTLYAATADGKFWSINLANPKQWTEVDGGLPKVAGNETASIVVDPHNPLHVFINSVGTAAGDGRIWVTSNGGKSWTSVAAKLPSTLAVFTLAVDWSAATPVLYAGTTRSLYASTNLGKSWHIFGTNLPLGVPIRDIERQGNVLVVATYGRGIWEAKL